MQDHVALLSADLEVGDGDLLVAVKVPAVFRGFLEVPDILAGIRLHRDDRGGIKAVAGAIGVAIGRVPRFGIGGPEIDQVGDRVIGDRIPHRAAAAKLPELARPGLGRGFQVLALLRLRGIARHGVEAPAFVPGFGIEGGQIAAGEIFGTGRTDQDHALRHPRRPGDRHVRSFGDGQLVPGHLAGLLIECDQPPVERADIDLVAIERDAAVDRVAAHIDQLFARDLGVVGPLERPGLGVIGLHHRPGGGDVEDAIVHQRRGFLPARGIEIGEPGHAELADVLVVDLVERGKALLGPVAAIGQPFGPRALGDQLVGHPRRRRSRHLFAACRQRQQHGKRQGLQSHFAFPLRFWRSGLPRIRRFNPAASTTQPGIRVNTLSALQPMLPTFRQGIESQNSHRTVGTMAGAG